MSGLLLIGGGGHCLTVIDALRSGEYEKVGIVDLPKMIGKTLNGLPYVGSDDDLEALRGAYDAAFVSLGSVGNWKRREELAVRLAQMKFDLATVIHARSWVSPWANIAPGALVASMCVVNACSDVGEMCILNTGCIVEHNCTVGPYAHIAPGSILCGGVRIGRGAHIGAGSVVRDGLSIGQNTLIGAGSVVIKEVPSNVVAYGNPCEIRKEVTQ